MNKRRIFAGLLVLTLLSTCIISGTFAKYTTSAEGSDNARVAKWGIQAPAALDVDMFDGAYDGTVTSKDGTNVVAPGTTKTATVTLASLTGDAPEVDYKFETKLTVDPSASTTIAQLDALENFKWTLKKPGDASATEYATFALLKAAFDGMSKETVKANNLPTGWATGDNKIDIGWKWLYEEGATDVKKASNSEADTAVGNMAAAGSLDTFTVTLSVEATQID